MMTGAFLILLFATLAASETCESLHAKKVDAYDDKRISQSVMWTLNNLTKAECMKECQREQYCVSFHFRPSGPVCVALRERFEGSSVPSVEALGYQLFQTNKPLAIVGSECELDVNCAPLTNSHCNEGVCRCDVGYGPDGNTCRILTECSTLSDNFTLYRSFFISGHDFLSQGATTYESCPAFCISDNRCKSADLDFVAKICYLNTHTWLGALASSRIKDSPEFDFFQRECLW
ncbi:uncharacterized protein LOC124148930 [Haliotis rufescens]|uniref:uncharacterized protein LOC124148930 n=1 Tax=Haliotis rufescens TaxID=6454 RepID=UPI00201F6D6A|nr:uncharacterized protein LOC124148930 [Haliotis rufescens]